MASSIRSAALTSTDFAGKGGDVKDHPMNSPGAKPCAAHSDSTDNPMSETKVAFKKPGNLGGTPG